MFEKRRRCARARSTPTWRHKDGRRSLMTKRNPRARWGHACWARFPVCSGMRSPLPCCSSISPTSAHIGWGGRSRCRGSRGTWWTLLTTVRSIDWRHNTRTVGPILCRRFRGQSSSCSRKPFWRTACTCSSPDNIWAILPARPPTSGANLAQICTSHTCSRHTSCSSTSRLVRVNYDCCFSAVVAVVTLLRRIRWSVLDREITDCDQLGFPHSCLGLQEVGACLIEVTLWGLMTSSSFRVGSGLTSVGCDEQGPGVLCLSGRFRDESRHDSSTRILIPWEPFDEAATEVGVCTVIKTQIH